ncbi:multiple sugar transport system permease protein [Spirochaetota bacterium]|nr:multiple sugar transport system permease protein [Spirochaetota bacterium]
MMSKWALYWKHNQQKWMPFVFLAPATLFFLVLIVYPIVESLRLSFFKWDGLGEKNWVGGGNYVELLSDHRFWLSVRNTFYWTVFFLIAPVVGLLLAIFLNQKIRGIRFVKSMFFFPFVISQVVVGLVFAWFYEPHNGLLNEVLKFLGMSPIAILSNENWVTFGIIAAGMWPQVAYCLIIYLTGLSGLSPTLIEAARLDRAKGWKMLWYIIIPQLRSATFVAVVISVIGALRSFDLISIMTGGGPYDSSSVLAYFMYDQTMFSYRMGYGAAIASVLFVLMDIYIVYFLIRLWRGERGTSDRSILGN